MRTVLGAAAARVKRRTAGARVAPVGFVVRRQYWSGRPPQLVAFRWAELLVLVVWGPVQELAVELLATGAGTWQFTPRWWNPLLVEVRASPITLALQVIWRVAAVHEVAPRELRMEDGPVPGGRLMSARAVMRGRVVIASLYSARFSCTARGARVCR